MMILDNTDISSLYNESLICGETYLYCVENNIDTIENLMSCEMFDISENIKYDIKQLKAYLNDGKSEQNPSCGSLGSDLVDIVVPENIIKTDVSVEQSAEYLYELIEELCLDVRAHNAIRSSLKIMHNGDIKSFVNWFLTCTPEDWYKMRNVGKKTIKILQEVREQIKLSKCQVKENASSTEINESLCQQEYNIPKEYSVLLELIWEQHIWKLPVRAQNTLKAYVCNNHNNDLVAAFNELCSHKFRFESLRNCGKNTAVELRKFIKDISDLVDDKLNGECNKVDTEYLTTLKQYRDILSISDDAIRDVITLEKELGYFPLFFVIQKYIEELDTRNMSILYGQIDIYNNQKLVPREDLCAQLNLSKERIRQLRDKIFRELQKYILCVEKIADTTNYTIDEISKINKTENTDFQDNFIYYTISLCDGQWKVIGDIETVFYNPYGHQVNLNIVPSHIAKEYDFNNFLRDFDGLYNTKRTVSTEVNLQNFCLKFFKKQVQIAILNDIVHECKKIIFRIYDCTSDGDTIIIGSNTYRGITEIAEDILRRHGKPLTASEFYTKFREEYPDRKCKSESSFISAARLNPKIKPIGRASTYTLDEWDYGESRSGTIREFSEEFLLQTEERIAPLSDIGNYVRQFRSTATDASIQSNLLAEASGKFGLFTKGSTKYIGFKNRDYDSSYIPAVESSIVARSLSTSRQLFEEFIVTHDRFPFSSGVDAGEQEKRLGRFWSNLVSKVNRGVASADELEMFRHIEDNYSDKNIPRNEYKWRETYKNIYALLQLGGRDALEESDQRWCYKYIQKLKNQQLESWQIPLIINLIELYVKG